jgi:diadenosine tetraphosphate (Ap4A) HIT family hydrolase
MYTIAKIDCKIDLRTMENSREDPNLHSQSCTRVDCGFCSQYITRSSENFWAKFGHRFGQDSDVIIEQKDSLLIAGMGALSEGYVLILPKYHYLSIASLPTALLLDVEDLKNKTAAALRSVYGSVVFF